MNNTSNIIELRHTRYDITVEYGKEEYIDAHYNDTFKHWTIYIETYDVSRLNECIKIGESLLTQKKKAQ